MKLKQLITAGLLSAASVSAVATPVYYGDTDATNISGGAMDTGYYIWNEVASPRTWHINWTSTNAVPGNLVNWFGSIVLEGGGLESTSTFKFETGGTYGDNINVDPGLFSDEIEWFAYTNDTGGVDGIEFTIDKSLDLLEFNLGSSLFAGLDEDYSGVAGTNIYLGDGFATPDVFVIDSAAGVYQSFEVHVPEPGTIGLLGLGLMGLGVARRSSKKQNS